MNYTKEQCETAIHFLECNATENSVEQIAIEALKLAIKNGECK